MLATFDFDPSEINPSKVVPRILYVSITSILQIITILQIYLKTFYRRSNQRWQIHTSSLFPILYSIIPEITRSEQHCQTKEYRRLYQRRDEKTWSMRRARPAELNFTRIFTWPQYFIGHLMPGHVLPCPSVARRPPMNQSAAFKDFFLIPGIRNPPYLAWNILRAISRLFLSFPPILSFFSHRFSISSLPFNAGDGLFVVGNALRERERERGVVQFLRRRKERKPLEIGNAEKTVGLLRCRVRFSS